MTQIPFTEEGFEKIKKEHADLLLQRPDAVGHLKRARELGDLSENGYYKASRAKLSFIDSRLRHLKHLLTNGKIIMSSTSDTVEIGKKITVSDPSASGASPVRGSGRVAGGERIFRMVGGFESDPSEGRISHISPLGKALMGAKVGETREIQTPSGSRKFKIIAIE